MARQGGAKRSLGLINEEARCVLKLCFENVLRDAVTYAEFTKRKTVTDLDAVYH